MRHGTTTLFAALDIATGKVVVKLALLTPRNSATSMVYRADRRRTRAPINMRSLTELYLTLRCRSVPFPTPSALRCQDTIII